MSGPEYEFKNESCVEFPDGFTYEPFARDISVVRFVKSDSCSRLCNDDMRTLLAPPSVKLSEYCGATEGVTSTTDPFARMARALEFAGRFQDSRG